MTDSNLDLVLERTVDVPADLLWRGWTDPALIVKWFTPAPWKTTEAKVDLRPGGGFETTMQSPEGESFPANGCYLEVVEGKKLVWTSALSTGFRPVPASPMALPFTAMLTFEPQANGATKYTARAMHADEEARNRHEAMGFITGWGAALDQLVAIAKTL